MGSPQGVLPQSKLLIDAVRKLTSTTSGDQRELEKNKLQRAYEESEIYVDKLIKEHHADVTQSLSTFRKVSTEITSSKQQIHNVKNALQTCKILLTNRRDELKKLWAESAEQKKVCEILEQIDEIKHVNARIKRLLNDEEYQEASCQLKRAEILLNGPLSSIEGLRSGINETSQAIFDEIVANLLKILIAEPFELQILEIVRRNQNEPIIAESPFCSQLVSKYASVCKKFISEGSQLNEPVDSRSNKFLGDTEFIKRKITESVEALNVFDHLNAALTYIFTRMPSICIKAVNEAMLVTNLLDKTNSPNSTQLLKLTKTIITQMKACGHRFNLMSAEMLRLRGPNEEFLANNQVNVKCWEHLQDVLEQFVSEHLGIWRKDDVNNDYNNDNLIVGGERSITKSQNVLFTFENTSFVNTSLNPFLRKRQLNTICPADPYNIITIFDALSRFYIDIETQLDIEQCRLHTYLHTFAMDSFIERARTDIEQQLGETTLSKEIWATQTVPSHNVKILSSCVKIFSSCEKIFEFIRNIELYAQRFASLWLLIIAFYTKNINDNYSQIIRTKLQRDTEIPLESAKISASWAVDEDISRLLKSLPSWIMLNQCSPSPTDLPTPVASTGTFVFASETEGEVKRRNQRESEIFISNLGTNTQIKRGEMITDMDNIKSLVCIHESLQWLTSNIRRLFQNLSEKSKEIIKCKIHLSSGEEVSTEKYLNEALDEQLLSLDQISETSLLILYLELRIHCFYHLLPLIKGQGFSQQDGSDRESLEFGRDLKQFHQTLQMYISPFKLNYLFDGLGHLCASIFVHSSQFMTRMTEDDRKRVCRNIYSVQKSLNNVTGRPENDLARAQMYYDLLKKEPDQILAHAERAGLHPFTYLEFNNLLSLSLRSHPTLSNHYGALDSRINKLKEIIQRGKHNN